MIVIYHGGGCLDGFGSAFAAWLHCQDQGITADYIPAQHGDIAPALLTQCQHKTVYLVDFCFPRASVVALCEQAAEVIVLDHHISAQNDMAGLDEQIPNLTLHFDMERSGAVITWEYFHKAPVPYLFQCIQDRDLWQFQVPDSQDVNAALMSYSFDFERWQGYLDEDALRALIAEGAAINRFRARMIEHHMHRAVQGTIGGYEVPVVNCPREIVSELVGRLAEHQPFAGGYCDRGNVRTWSLRSRGEGLDVSVIAAQYGGGGHARAAGFKQALAQTELVLPEY